MIDDIYKNIEQNEDLQDVEQVIVSNVYLLMILFGSVVSCFALILYSFKLCKQYETDGYLRNCLESPTLASENDASISIEASGLSDTEGDFSI